MPRSNEEIYQHRRDSEKVLKRIGNGIILSAPFLYATIYSGEKMIAGDMGIVESVAETIRLTPTDPSHFVGVFMTGTMVMTGFMMHLVGRSEGHKANRMKLDM